MAVAALILLLMYLLPMWSISLDAPQYPEGLGLKIYINTIIGAQENDLQNINGLNHYIGMKRIEPDSIAELRYMPVIIGALIVLGLLIAWKGTCRMVGAWVLLFVVLSIVGVTDFYLWEYDYGHNLDPHAAIKIDGMSYQPPLLGSKQLLNFTAYSYPDISGYIAGVSILLGAAAFVLSCNRKRILPAKNITAATSVVLASLILVSCEPKPQSISVGQEECAHCKMSISDKRFAAELLTQKGKAYKFDAIECMAAFVGEKTVAVDDIHSLWVVDFAHPDEFLNTKKSFFLHSPLIQSPMSMNLAAFPSREAFDKAQKQFGGELYYWDSVRLLVAKGMGK